MADIVDAFVATLPASEGCILFMYCDTNPKGLVTVGIGKMLRDKQAAHAVRFVHGDDLRRATEEEIDREYDRVKAVWERAPWKRKGTLEYKNLASASYRPTDPHAPVITLEEAKRLAADHVRRETLPGVTKLFPRFDTFPESARLALLDIAYQYGVGGLKKKEALCAAVKAEHWDAAAIAVPTGVAGAGRTRERQERFRDAAASVRRKAGVLVVPPLADGGGQGRSWPERPTPWAPPSRTPMMTSLPSWWV